MPTKWTFQVETKSLLDEVGGAYRVTMDGQREEFKPKEPSLIRVQLDGWDGDMPQSLFIGERKQTSESGMSFRPKKRFSSHVWSDPRREACEASCDGQVPEASDSCSLRST